MQQTTLWDEWNQTLPQDQSGFRLICYEVLNWGTFHKAIWSMPLKGRNALLTGEIGSGKSTLVDGLLTLFYPYQKITFNQAAGALKRERSLLSYVQGHYRQSEQGVLSLRDSRDHTVLLVQLYHAGKMATVTLATVLWSAPDGQLQQFFVVSEQALTIQSDFLNFSGSLSQLKAQLKKQPFLNIYEHFKDYQGQFMRLLGIPHEQALHLFYQTVSLKAIGNLTEFIRNHMLDPQDLQAEIDQIQQDFDNLEQSWQAVVQARRQQTLLAPLVEQYERFQALGRQQKHTQQNILALPLFFEIRRHRLLTQTLAQEQAALARQEAQISEIQAEQLRERRDLEENKLTLRSNPEGQRQVTLQQEIRELRIKSQVQKKKSERYTHLLTPFSLAPPLDRVSFERTQQQLQTVHLEIQEETQRLRESELQAELALQPLKEQQHANQHELAALARRKTLLPEEYAELRRQLCKSLNFEEEALPFVAELVQVLEHEKKWTGPLERLLRGFALSLLVKDEHYPQVLEWVERERLPLRLVYYRLPEFSSFDVLDNDPEWVFSKLEFKDHPFQAWIQSEIQQRYALRCCEDLKDYKSQQDALSLQGQIKRRGRFHEKDDRFPLHDSTRFVLGWSNQQKIRALQDKLADLEQAILALEQTAQHLRTQQQSFQQSLSQIQELLLTQDYSDLDYRDSLARLNELQHELEILERSSDQLQQLRLAVERGERRIADLDKEAASAQQQLGKLRNRLEHYQVQLQDLSPEAAEEPSPEVAALQEGIPEWQEPQNLEELKRREQEIGKHYYQELQKLEEASRFLENQLIEGVGHWRETFPLEAVDLPRSLLALPELTARYTQLKHDDFPRFEQRFKELLQTETTRGLLLLWNRLDEAQKEIKQKIKQINSSLEAIDYHPGSYIQLKADPLLDHQIQDFKAALKDCLSAESGESYSEARFHKVKALIDQLSGRSQAFLNQPEMGRRWREKVTDVRQWFSYTALELWREDGSERERYRDSGGKSGGQKEKLAYTILASALAYQFGLSRQDEQERSFRFVMIDEAFGKGSDESTRYALELFQRFHLQVLVVTPRTKVAVISPFVETILYAHNHQGERSSVNPITIQALQAQRVGSS